MEIICCGTYDDVDGMKSPVESIVPMFAGETDHVTAVSLVLAVVPTNCWVWKAVIVTRGGATVIDTGGSRVTVAVPRVAPDDWLVAVTDTVCWTALRLGAVYSPVVVIEPAFVGLIAHATLEALHAPNPGTWNCCARDA